MSHIIDISSSPEPSPSYAQPPQRTSKVKLTAKRQRTRIGPVIELTDSESDAEGAPARPRQKVASPRNATPGSSSRPRRTPTSTQLQPMVGGSGSLQNIPSQSRRTKTPTTKPLPCFLPSDEENEPPVTVHPAVDQAPIGIVGLDNEPAPLQIAQQEPLPVEQPLEPELERDPLSGYVARILEIIPDVEPDHLLALATKFAPSLQDGVVEHVLHALFEDPTYPKVDRKGKGKRKQTDEHVSGEGTAVEGSTPTKKHKIDYADKTRAFRGGVHYTDLALEQLQIDNPYIPKPYLRQLLASFNGLYAPTHIFLVEQEKQRKENSAVAHLPYTRKTQPFRPSAKGKARILEDAEFKKELDWLQEEAERQDRQVAEEVNEEENGDGIECGCCFSTVPFDKVVQCPETHLFCSQCMNSYAATLLGSHDPNIKCMDQSGCTAAIPPSELRRFLPTKMMELWERVKQRKEVEAAGLEGLEECPFCEWGCVIENEEEKLFRCGNVDACGVVSCRGCKKVDHLPKSCKEVEEDKNLDGRHAIEEAMTRALMRNCPKCQKPFVKEHGCNKMTCPNCQTLSCYICRQVITGYDHFNQLPSGQAAPATSTNASKCLLWDAVEQRHADEVKAAAERALEEYKRNNPDVDEKALHVDLPPAPAAPAPPIHGAHFGLGHYGLMGQNQAHAAQVQAAQVQLVQLQNQRNHCQMRIEGFEAQTQLMRAAAMQNPYPQFAQLYLQRQVDMAEVVEQERQRLVDIQARFAEAQARLDAARANAAAAQPPPQPAAHPAFNINLNIYGHQPVRPAMPPPARRRKRR